ncbi:MAG: hypothetical protein IPK19_16120 [Chloroflexi bacterium]|nr:hypothetical protein [Chloroflexota bacterium]
MKSEMHFPDLTATSTDGQTLELPRDFSGKLNVAVISFSRDQQPDAATWHDALEELRRSHANLALVQLFVAPVLPYWYQAAQNAVIRSSVPTQRNITTLSAHVDLNEFNRALDIPTVSTIYTLLVNRPGAVLWASQGPCDTNRYTSLKRTVRRVANSTVAAGR